MTKKILFVVPHRLGRSPGQRFRCEQYLSHLETNGIQYTYSNLLGKTDDFYFYKNGYVIKKFFIFLKSIIIRFFDVMRCLNYDFIYIYRETLMIGSVFYERLFWCLGRKIIYDFDDSIWLNDTSDGNKQLSWLKRPSKTADICKMATTVVVGNDYLKEYASKYCNNVVILPTTIDTLYHKKKIRERNSSVVVIGWTGTSTTLKHFQTLLPALRELVAKYGERIMIKVIADVPCVDDVIPISFSKWNIETEIDDLSVIDIGIMPLPDDEWSRGKCGFKGLQYMSLSLPAVMSPVGMNTDIIDHGINGFLASSQEEWFQILSMLIESPELRKRVGECGRKTIEERYSVEANKPLFLSLFD